MRAPRLLFSLPFLALVAACPPGEGADGEGDGDGDGNGRPPFRIVDAGVSPDAGVDAPCAEDAHEDNDTPEAATPVTAGVAVDGRFCGGDDDWYAIDVAAADCALSATVRVAEDAPAGEGEGEGESALADLDLVVVDGAGAVVGAAAGLGPRESLNVRLGAAGRYAVRVRGGSEDDVGYTLTLDVACGGDQVCPADDAHEDNDTSATPATLDEGVPVDAAVCGGDDDFWTIPVAPGCFADIQASFVHSRGDVDLAVFLRAGGAAIAQSNGTSNVERITKVFVDPASLALRAELFNGNDVNVGNAYRLVVDEICLGDLGCPGDDPNEDNDTRQTAKVLGRDDVTLGASCGVDEDFFRVTPQAGCTTTFHAAFLHRDGDIDMELQDNGSGARIQLANSSDDDEEIVFTAPNGAAVVLRVFGFSGAQNRYRLTTSTTCP